MQCRRIAGLPGWSLGGLTGWEPSARGWTPKFQTRPKCDIFSPCLTFPLCPPLPLPSAPVCSSSPIVTLFVLVVWHLSLCHLGLSFSSIDHTPFTILVRFSIRAARPVRSLIDTVRVQTTSTPFEHRYSYPTTKASTVYSSQASVLRSSSCESKQPTNPLKEADCPVVRADIKGHLP